MSAFDPAVLSRELTAMQHATVALLRSLSCDPGADVAELSVYARWYCKRAVAQELALHGRAAVKIDSPVDAPSRKLRAFNPWADQVQSYLNRRGSAAVAPAATT